MFSDLDRSQINVTTLCGVLLGVLVFIRTMPFYFWPYENTIRPICAILVMFICVFNISKDRWSYWIFLLVAASYAWAVFFVDHSGVMVFLNWVTFAFIVALRKEVVLKAYQTLRVILVVLLTLSILNYILWFFDLAGYGTLIDPLNSGKAVKYLKYPFLVTISGSTSMRFFAIFDEPGMLGTICGLILVSEQMNLKKPGNWVFLLAGLLSMSFYFYVALILGLVLFSTNLKYRWLIVPVFAAALLVSYNNPVIHKTVWSRFEWNAEEGKVSGDNRSDDVLNKHYESIKGTRAFFTGEGTKVAQDYINSASLKLIIVKHGFIYLFLNLLGFALLSFREITNKLMWFPFFIFFILTLYQRPGFYGLYSISLYTMVIYNFGKDMEIPDDEMIDEEQDIIDEERVKIEENSVRVVNQTKC